MNHLLSMRYVAAGGAIGGLARWAVVHAVDDRRAAEAILALNVIGSILLGVLVGLQRTRGGRRRVTTNQFLLVGTGFCGALTTFSTFAVQVATALDDGAIARAAAIGFGTAAVTVVGAGIGYRLGSRP